MRKRIFFCIILISMVISIIACASIRTGGGDLESSIHAYWNARIEGDHKKAFTYEQMSLSESMRQDDYAKNILKHGININSFEIIDVQYEDKNRAVVKMEVIHTVPPIGNIEIKKSLKNVFQDTWVMINGKWYHLIKKPGGGEDIQFLQDMKSLPAH